MPTGGSSSAKSASELGIPPDAPMAELFGMNGIAPFHHHVSTDPKEKENLWPEHIRRLQMANELGAKSMRMDLWWGIIEPEKDKFDWSVPDRAFEEIVKAGLEPYPILCYASAWSKDVSPDTPEERERFGKYVFATVSRFKDKAHRWEFGMSRHHAILVAAPRCGTLCGAAEGCLSRGEKGGPGMRSRGNLRRWPGL